MTEIYGLFDAADPEAPDRVYTSEAFARLFKTMMRDGIVHNDGAELAVGPTVPAAMSVSVGTGMALIQGRYYINDSDLTLNVEAADPSHPRIDRVVVRLEATPGRTIHAVVKKGTPAPSPVPPGLTRTAETWELSLAQVRVEAGATSIVAGKITDERGNTSLCGVAAPVYVPSSQVEVVGAINMQGHALTGLPVPSAGTDAARKGYVDEVIGGFGISQIAIDADKNWNGKSITNVGAIDTYTGNVGARSQFVDIPGNTVRKSVSYGSTIPESTTRQVASVVVPTNYSSVPLSSNLRVVVKAPSWSGPHSAYAWRVTVKRNGVEIGSASGSVADKKTLTVDTTGGFAAGDTLTVGVSTPSNSAMHGCTTSFQSARSTDTPAYKIFQTSGSW
jgi:hypothetical protein